MKKNILLIAMFLTSFNSLAFIDSEWEYPVLGVSTIWELHVVKNDGMDTHMKYRCAALSNCWKKYEEVRYRSNNFMYVKGVWMERLNRKIQIIK
jgi:hypothetical protein